MANTITGGRPNDLVSEWMLVRYPGQQHRAAFLGKMNWEKTSSNG